MLSRASSRLRDVAALLPSQQTIRNHLQRVAVASYGPSGGCQVLSVTFFTEFHLGYLTSSSSDRRSADYNHTSSLAASAHYGGVICRCNLSVFLICLMST